MPKQKQERADAVFFAAHADDLDLCCGGTIAHFVENGLTVAMIELTHGEMGTRGTPKTRRAEAEAARKILGVSIREELDFGDGALRTGREEELQVIEVLRRLRPQVVFAPWPDERHPDHARTGQLVTDAWFYAGLRAMKTKHEGHRAQTVCYYLQNYMVTPSFVVDVSHTWEKKMTAIRQFKSQFHDPKSKAPETFISKQGFLEMIEARGVHFGALIGARYGEAYITKQPPKIQDVISAYSGREV
jgi:bacillithiol biosynthesis deacetylase BshB1